MRCWVLPGTRYHNTRFQSLSAQPVARTVCNDYNVGMSNRISFRRSVILWASLSAMFCGWSSVSYGGLNVGICSEKTVTPVNIVVDLSDNGDEGRRVEDSESETLSAPCLDGVSSPQVAIACEYLVFVLDGQRIGWRRHRVSSFNSRPPPFTVPKSVVSIP